MIGLKGDSELPAWFYFSLDSPWTGGFSQHGFNLAWASWAGGGSAELPARFYFGLEAFPAGPGIASLDLISPGCFRAGWWADLGKSGKFGTNSGKYEDTQ